MCASCWRREKLAARPPKICAMPDCTGIVERRGRRIYCPDCMTGRRQARGLARPGSDGVTGWQIIERDGWRCQMPRCLEPTRVIPRDVPSTDPRSASVDHIVPRSLHGDETELNKRAAHRRCNIARGNDFGSEPVPLLGWSDLPPAMSKCRDCGDLFPQQGPRRLCDDCRPARREPVPAAAREAAREARRLLALQLRDGGRMTWDEVAPRLGVKTASGAYLIAYPPGRVAAAS